MNKVYLLLSFGLILVLLGCVQTEPEVKYVCPDGMTTVTDIASCPAVGATTRALTLEEELSVCAGMPSIATGSFEDSCIIGVAAKHQDASLCKRVLRDQRLLCYTTIAELEDSADVCLEAESMEDQCLEQYALGERDSSICIKIANITNRDNCYSKLASQLSDPELCDKIRNAGQKDSCYFDMAMRFADSAYCSKITNISQQQSCIQNLLQRGSVQQMPVPIEK